MGKATENERLENTYYKFSSLSSVRAIFHVASIRLSVHAVREDQLMTTKNRVISWR